jgi:cytoskeletal protein CcmA (bactofilin family)
MPAPESPTNRESIVDDPSRHGLADSLSDTSPYFEAWLDSLRPSAKIIERPAPASQFNFEGTLHLDGYLTGVVRSQTGTLIIDETAELEANIFVATAVVEGLVRGDIRATERVELGNQARVMGNIETPALSIQPGAMFEGQCHFLPPAKNDSEQIAPTSVGDSKGAKGSSRKTRSKPDPQEEAEAMALAAGR